MKTTAGTVVRRLVRLLAILMAACDPISYFAFFHWPDRRGPRWRFWLEWTLVGLSIAIVVVGPVLVIAALVS